MGTFLRRTFGAIGLILLSFSLLYTEVGTEITSVPTNVGSFYTSFVNLYFIWFSTQIMWNMLTFKQTKKSLFEKLNASAILIIVATITVSISALIRGEAFTINLPWMLTLIFLPIFGWYEKKYFGFEQ